MDSKTMLLKFIDAVIADDAEQEKQVFAQYTETRTQELLGLNKEVATTESAPAVQNEFKFEGDTVYHQGKKIGMISYAGKDEFKPDELVYTADKGKGVKFKNTQELMDHLKAKHGEKV